MNSSYMHEGRIVSLCCFGEGIGISMLLSRFVDNLQLKLSKEYLLAAQSSSHIFETLRDVRGF